MGPRKKLQHVVVDGMNEATGRGKQGQHVGVPATLVAGTRIGAFGEQEADGIGAPVLRGQHQCRAPIPVLGFEFRSGFQQGFDAIGVALFRRGQPIFERDGGQGNQR